MDKKRIQQVFKGSLVLAIVFVILLLSFYGIASSDNETVRRVFFIIFFSFVGAGYIAYWIYMYIYFKKQDEKAGVSSKASDKSGEKEDKGK